MANRWRNRPQPPPGQGRVYWHILFHDNPEVWDLARAARRRLDGLSGFDFVPQQWLHLTMLVAGRTGEITADAVNSMVTETRRLLWNTRPITVALGRVLYHPEAIMLAVWPV